VIDPGGPATAAELDAVGDLVATWLGHQLEENPAVQAVERDTGSDERRWFVRMAGEEKSVFTVWFHLQQRTLHIETYVMPAPLERSGELYEYLLRRNLKLHGLAFAVGAEDAVFLVGRLPVSWITEVELDRVLGSFYAAVEQVFRPAMRIGFGSRFTG